MTLPFDWPPLSTVGLRLLAIAGALVAWHFSQRLIGERALEGERIVDHLHQLTTPANTWLHEHPGAAKALLIVSSLAIDLSTLFVLAYAVVGPSFLPFWGLLALFVLRFLSQTAVALPTPTGIIWRDPGFPSLFVTYAVTNDFFFSGHTALAVYGAMQMAGLGLPALTALAVLLAVSQMVLLIVLRAHWTLDVITGALAALCIGLLFSGA